MHMHALIASIFTFSPPLHMLNRSPSPLTRYSFLSSQHSELPLPTPFPTPLYQPLKCILLLHPHIQHPHRLYLFPQRLNLILQRLVRLA